MTKHQDYSGKYYHHRALDLGYTKEQDLHSVVHLDAKTYYDVAWTNDYSKFTKESP